MAASEVVLYHEVAVNKDKVVPANCLCFELTANSYTSDVHVAQG